MGGDVTDMNYMKEDWHKKMAVQFKKVENYEN